MFVYERSVLGLMLGLLMLFAYPMGLFVLRVKDDIKFEDTGDRMGISHGMGVGGGGGVGGLSRSMATGLW